MARTRPIGIPRGKRPPAPDVTTRSPIWMPLPSRAMYLKRSVPRGSPSTMPWVRVRTAWAPTVEVGSMSTCTIEAPGRTSTTRPISPSGAITAVSRVTRSARPRLTVSERTQPPHSRAMTSPDNVASGIDSFSANAGSFTVDPRTNRSGRDGHLLEQIELVEHLAGSERDAGERVLALGHRQVGFLAQQVVKAAQQRPAAGQHDALVHDVGGQL